MSLVIRACLSFHLPCHSSLLVVQDCLSFHIPCRSNLLFNPPRLSFEFAWHSTPLVVQTCLSFHLPCCSSLLVVLPPLLFKLACCSTSLVVQACLSFHLPCCSSLLVLLPLSFELACRSTSLVVGHPSFVQQKDYRIFFGHPTLVVETYIFSPVSSSVRSSITYLSNKKCPIKSEQSKERTTDKILENIFFLQHFFFNFFKIKINNFFLKYKHHKFTMHIAK